jgi:cation diffusion facilitator family transporter
VTTAGPPQTTPKAPSANPTSADAGGRPSQDLSRWGWLSVGAAIATLSLKSAAWAITGSVGMMSDALESLVNLAAGLLAVYSLRFAAQPPDAEHPHGHGKIEYFSSGIEGALILFAGGGILISALPRFLHPVAVTKLDIGLLLSSVATIVNLVVGLLLRRVGRRAGSLTLEADGQHLLTDVWTSVGVFVGLVGVRATGYIVLDPLIACLMALQIGWIGLGLLRRSVDGLLDSALPRAEQELIEAVLARFAERGMQYHALRTRLAGRRRFVSVHLLVPPEWTVLAGHQLAEEVEKAIRDALAGAVVFTHIEPSAHPESDEDIPLDRE